MTGTQENEPSDLCSFRIITSGDYMHIYFNRASVENVLKNLRVNYFQELIMFNIA